MMITILEQPCWQLCKAVPSENNNIVKQTYSELQYKHVDVWQVQCFPRLNHQSIDLLKLHPEDGTEGQPSHFQLLSSLPLCTSLMLCVALKQFSVAYRMMEKAKFNLTSVLNQ